MKGCESCRGNVAPGKKCWACGLAGPAEPAKCTCDGLDVCTTCYMTMANTGKVFRSEPEPAKPPQTEAPAKVIAELGLDEALCHHGFSPSEVCNECRSEDLHAQNLEIAMTKRDDVVAELERERRTASHFQGEANAAIERTEEAERARSILEKAICDVQDIAAGPFGPGMFTMDSALDLIRKITSPLVDSFAGKPISEDDRVNFARWLLDDTDFHVTNFDAGRNYK